MRAEEFAEDNFGTNPRRPARSGARPSRGHKPVPRYRSMEEGNRVKTPSGMYRDTHTGVAYSKPTGQDGHDSYMTPAYMLDQYKKELARITKGPYKRTREVAQLKAKIAKLEKKQGEPKIAEEKIKGVDGKACWKGYRYAGKEQKADGSYKDRCVKVGENSEEKIAGRYDPEDFDAMVQRVGQKAQKKPMTGVSPIVKRMRDELAQIDKDRDEKSS
jgi:hypothetical protein